MKSTHYILSIIVLLFSGCNLITDYKLDTNPDYLKEVGNYIQSYSLKPLKGCKFSN